MSPALKIFIGGLATLLLAWLCHHHSGQAYLNNLDTQAKAKIAENSDWSDVNVAFGNSRVAMLSGTTNPGWRTAIDGAMMTVPGISGTQWDKPAEAAATAAQVQACQDKVNTLITGKTINFDTGSANISVDLKVLVDSIAAEMKNCSGTTIEIAGHTDNSGNPDTNMKLSQDRAIAVENAMKADGVPGDRMIAKGYGQIQPLDPANTDAARAKNRRIEFHVVSTAGTEG